MNIKKRADADEVSPSGSTADPGKKPVIIYILILFLAAFSLMFLSLLANQRSNSEALGRLQSSMSAIQGIQEAQEQIISLQEEINTVEKERDNALKSLDDTEQELAEQKLENEALLALYTLQQEYLAGDLDSCRLTLQQFSDHDLDTYLPETHMEGVTSPAQRYAELKDAILNA